MKINELRGRTVDELKTLLAEERVKLGTLRFKASTASLKAMRDIRKTRRNIAQILTMISLRARAGEKSLTGSTRAGGEDPARAAKKGAMV